MCKKWHWWIVSNFIRIHALYVPSFTVILLFECYRIISLDLDQLVSNLFLTMVHTVHYPSLQKQKKKGYFERWYPIKYDELVHKTPKCANGKTYYSEQDMFQCTQQDMYNMPCPFQYDTSINRNTSAEYGKT